MQAFLTHTIALVVGFGCGIVFSRNVRDGIADLHGKVDKLTAEVRAKL